MNGVNYVGEYFYVTCKIKNTSGNKVDLVAQMNTQTSSYVTYLQNNLGSIDEGDNKTLKIKMFPVQKGLLRISGLPIKVILLW